MIFGRSRFLCAGLVFLLTIFVSHAHAEEFKGPTTKPQIAESLPSRSPRPDCGPKALLIAASLLGHPLNYPELIKGMDINASGVSFGSLKNAAQNSGFEASLERLTGMQLLTLYTTAVILVDKDHFMAIDCRNTRTNDKNSFRVYDTDSPFQEWSLSQLEKRWRGEVLVLQTRPSGEQNNGPRIIWDTCFRDLGFVEPDRVAHYEFPFRNIGDEPLMAKIAELGCGCTRAHLQPETIRPGETGCLIADIDFSQKQGFFQTYVTVGTNDVKLPDCVLLLRAGVRGRHIVSQDALYFGNLQRGQKTSKKFFVHDRGDGRLRLGPVHVRVGLKSKSVGQNCIASEAKILTNIDDADNYKYESSRFRIGPDDLLIEISLLAGENCAAGDLEGEVVAETGLPGEYSQIHVALKGRVDAGVITEPSALILSGEHPEGNLTLTSNSGRMLKIREVHVEGALLLKVTEADSRSDEKLSYRVSLQKPISSSSNSVENATLVFTMENRDSVKVPVILLH